MTLAKISGMAEVLLHSTYKIDSPIYRSLLRRFSVGSAAESFKNLVDSLPQLPQPFFLIYSQGAFTSKPPSLTAHSLARIGVAGSTIVLKQIDLFDKEMHEACMLLSRQWQAPVHANLYYTPAKRQGYSAHFDFHDTVIWQICGAKHWRLWSPPLAVDERINVTSVIYRACRYRRNSKLVLETGFALEIPAGLVHCAKATGFGSIHVTFGIYKHTFCFYWLQILAELARLGKYENSLSDTLVKTLRAKTTGQTNLSSDAIRELDGMIFSKLLDYVRR